MSSEIVPASRAKRRENHFPVLQTSSSLTRSIANYHGPASEIGNASRNASGEVVPVTRGEVVPAVPNKPVLQRVAQVVDRRIAEHLNFGDVSMVDHLRADKGRVAASTGNKIATDLGDKDNTLDHFSNFEAAEIALRRDERRKKLQKGKPVTLLDVVDGLADLHLASQVTKRRKQVTAYKGVRMISDLQTNPFLTKEQLKEDKGKIRRVVKAAKKGKSGWEAYAKEASEPPVYTAERADVSPPPLPLPSPKTAEEQVEETHVEVQKVKADIERRAQLCAALENATGPQEKALIIKELEHLNTKQPGGEDVHEPSGLLGESLTGTKENVSLVPLLEE